MVKKIKNKKKMKEKTKRVLLNTLYIFLLAILYFFTFQTYQDYNYYRTYYQGNFIGFLSMRNVLIWNFNRALYLSIMQSVIYIPILILLEKSKMQNMSKIILTLTLTFFITIIYISINFVSSH